MTPGQYAVVMKVGGDGGVCVFGGGGATSVQRRLAVREAKLVSAEPKARRLVFVCTKVTSYVPCSATSISGRSLDEPLVSKRRERRLQIQMSTINKEVQVWGVVGDRLHVSHESTGLTASR